MVSGKHTLRSGVMIRGKGKLTALQNGKYLLVLSISKPLPLKSDKFAGD